MQFINYFFASIVSFLGLFAGFMLVRIAPEEQYPLRKYFKLLRYYLIAIIFIFLSFYYFNRIFYISLLAALLGFSVFLEKKITNLPKKTMIAYQMLGILFFLSSINQNLFVMASSFIFLYGLPSASLIYDGRKKNYSEIFAYNIGFLAISNLLFFLGYHFSFLILR